MNTDKVRLNITLPNKLVQLIDRMTSPRKRSRFIAEAIELKIRRSQKEALEKKLAEGYRAGYQEGIDIASEFEPADLEGWDDY